jgi:hypothetical protein
MPNQRCGMRHAQYDSRYLFKSHKSVLLHVASGSPLGRLWRNNLLAPRLLSQLTVF